MKVHHLSMVDAKKIFNEDPYNCSEEKVIAN